MKQASFLSMAIAFLLLLCPPVRLGAQASLGFRAGINVATFGGGPIDTSYEYREGVNIGAYLDLSVSEKVGLQIGVGYGEKGADLTAETELGTLDWKNPIGYLEIPILLRVDLATGSRVSPQVMFGPTISLKTSCKWETEVSGSPLKLDCDGAGFDYRTMDFGAMGGLSVKVALSDGIALVGGSLYTIGLRSIGEGGDSVKNRAFSITLGLAFPLG
ncbi:MAG: PorT family protein [Gemmatimonadetes bacterium]|nr:PorT family protein [Gemmatimonadota bacterium]